MRYMMIVKATKESEAGAPPNAELMQGMDKLSQEMIQKGVLLSHGGLQPSATGMRLKLSGGKLSVTDGPFAETKEVIGGFAILEAASKEEALKLANRCIDVHAKAGMDCDMEVRLMYDDGPCAATFAEMQAESA